MRVYKTIANVVLSQNNIVFKIIGNTVLGFAMVGGSFGSLFSASNQTSNEFETFHWPVITMFVGEYVVWEPISTLS